MHATMGTKTTLSAAWAVLAASTLIAPGEARVLSAPDPAAGREFIIHAPRPHGLVDGASAAGSSGLARVVRTAAARRGSTLRRYDHLIARHAERYGVRAELVRAIIKVESNFNPRALSRKGARGLMQLMPGTAAAFKVTDSFDPEQNIRGGVAYLSRLLNRYANDETLALAAYNAGPTAVARYGNRVPPYRETRNYIRKVRAATRASSPQASRHVIYRVETGSGSPHYTNVRPSSASFSVVRADR